MSTKKTPEELDKWAAWLLHRRDGDDAAQRRKALDYLLPVRDRVLDGARVALGDIVLDVGAGDGLIAFGAVERVGEFWSYPPSRTFAELLGLRGGSHAQGSARRDAGEEVVAARRGPSLVCRPRAAGAIRPYAYSRVPST